MKHNGTSETLSDLRSSFWIVRGRQLVRSLISKCVICKRLEGRAYNLPPAAPLPDFRVIEDYAFANIGVDFAGPVYVKDVYISYKSMDRAYIAIFTCTVSRALHLELCPDQSAPSFIKCFKRFQGRRGIPKLVVSDNGKTFRDKSVFFDIEPGWADAPFVPLEAWPTKLLFVGVKGTLKSPEMKMVQ